MLLLSPSEHRGKADPCHNAGDVAVSGNAIRHFAATFDGRYWARTSDPQLVDSEQHSRQFTHVRPERMVERNQSASEHLTERERTSSVAIVATRIQIPGDGTHDTPA
jgi:hypothetical protein